MKNYSYTKDLSIKLTIMYDDDIPVKSFTISVDDYIDETIGKKCQNVADDRISNMLKSIIKEKQQN